MSQAVHFGAGNIGRGFIGALLSDAGYHVTFADIVEPLINALNEHKKYTIHILDVSAPDKPIEINNVSGIISTNESAMMEALLNADIITTAVGPAVLKIIARTLAKGVTARREAGKGTLNVIACENMTGASEHLKEAVLSHLQNEEDKEYIASSVGFANCAVDRIVPPFDTSKSENILSVGVEAFYEWIVDETALKEPKPHIKGMTFTDNLIAYVQRKLFTLNCGHAITAYLGFCKGYATVDEALKDEWVEDIVHNAMLESGAALCKKHGFNFEDHKAYIEKIMNRFRNPYIKDDVVRVGRDPLRKLGKADRLVGPTLMCKEFDLPHENLEKGIAAALCYKNHEDPQCKEMHQIIEQGGIEKVIEDVAGFPKGSPESQDIVKAFEELNSSFKE